MTTPLRKPHTSPVGFEFEKSSKINPPIPRGDFVARPMLARLAAETFLRGLQKKPIETP
jgi:hypothetical protein